MVENFHFALFVDRDSVKNIEIFLQEQRISFDKTSFIDDRVIISFDINENSDNYSLVNDYFEKFNPIVTSKIIYSKEELDNAQWLSVLCYCGKIEVPTDEAYNAIYSDFCPGCKNKERNGLYRIKRVPKWKNQKNFCSTDTGGWDELFCSSYAKRIIEENNINGIEFLPVLHYKSLQQLEDIWQVKINAVLNPIEIGFSPEPIITYCNICHKLTYKNAKNTSQPTFKQVDLDGLDAFIIPVKTAGCSITVISNRLYRILKYGYKEKSLEFAACKNYLSNQREVLNH